MIRYTYQGDGVRGFEPLAAAHDPETMVARYRAMLRIRRIEEEIERRYHQDEMHCRINGCAGSRGGSMHLIDKAVGMAGTSAIVGGAVPIATGAALAAQMQGEDRVVVAFLGDATTEEGVTSESLNFAALKKVPVIFFCENNFYSVQSPLSTRQPPRDIHKWAATY